MLQLRLQQSKLFDAELSMAGIFEVTFAARVAILEALTLGRLLLLPVLLTDEADPSREAARLDLWKAFLHRCHCFWLDTSHFSLGSVEFSGHGDSVQIDLEVGRRELAEMCEFPCGSWQEAFQAAIDVSTGTVPISLWISSLDLTAHFHLPARDQQCNRRLNCIILGSDLKKMTFFGDQKGCIQAVPAGTARNGSIVKDWGADTCLRTLGIGVWSACCDFVGQSLIEAWWLCALCREI